GGSSPPHAIVPRSPSKNQQRQCTPHDTENHPSQATTPARRPPAIATLATASRARRLADGFASHHARPLDDKPLCALATIAAVAARLGVPTRRRAVGEQVR